MIRYNLNLIFGSIFSLLFFLYYFTRIDYIYVSILIFVIIFFLSFPLMYDYLKNFSISSFKKFKFYIIIKISLIILVLLLFDLFNFDFTYNYEIFAKKKSCNNLIIYFDQTIIWNKIFYNFVCTYSRSLNYLILIFLVIFLINFYEKLSFPKIFFYVGIFFSIISIIHFIYDLNIRINYAVDEDSSDWYHNWIKINNSNNLAYFQLLPFYSSGFRNIEITPLILGYVSSLYLLINSKENKYYYFSCFLGICLFLTFARVAWVLAFFLIVFYIFYNKHIISKYILFQLVSFITFVGIFTYLWNYSNIIFPDSENLIRSNFLFYSLMKISSMFSTELSNYFNYLNQSGWYYYNIYENSDSYINIETIITQESKKEFYNEYVELYMQQHLNSVPSRVEIYSQGIDLIKQKFLFGHSVNKFSFGLLNSDIHATIQNKMITRSNAESDFFQTFIEHGVFAFILKITLFFYLFYINVNEKNIFINALILTLFIFSIFVSISFYFFYWIILSVIIYGSSIHRKIIE